MAPTTSGILILGSPRASRQDRVDWPRILGALHDVSLNYSHSSAGVPGEGWGWIEGGGGAEEQCGIMWHISHIVFY